MAICLGLFSLPPNQTSSTATAAASEPPKQLFFYFFASLSLSICSSFLDICGVLPLTPGRSVSISLGPVSLDQSVVLVRRLEGREREREGGDGWRGHTVRPVARSISRSPHFLRKSPSGLAAADRRSRTAGCEMDLLRNDEKNKNKKNKKKKKKKKRKHRRLKKKPTNQRRFDSPAVDRLIPRKKIEEEAEEEENLQILS